MKVNVFLSIIIVALLFFGYFLYMENQGLKDQTSDKLIELRDTRDSLRNIRVKFDSVINIKKEDYSESKEKIKEVIYIPYTDTEPSVRADSIRSIIREEW